MKHTFIFNDREEITVEQSGETWSLSSTIERSGADDYTPPSQWDSAADTLESFILAAVNAGIPVDDKFREAVNTTFDAIANNYGDE